LGQPESRIPEEHLKRIWRINRNSVKVSRGEKVHVAAWKGDITEKHAALTMPNLASSYPKTTSVSLRRSIRSFILRPGHSIDGVLFPREQRAFRQSAMVRSSAKDAGEVRSARFKGME